MARILSVFFALWFYFSILPVPLATAETKGFDKSAIFKEAQLQFSLKLLKADLEKEKNIVVSPFSIYMIADLLANGAQTETLAKLREKITDPEGKLSMEDINSLLMQYIENLSSAVEINNSVWGNKFRFGYIKTVQSLKADIFVLPKSTDRINDWVEKKTHGYTKNIIEKKKTDPNDLFLVNTVYFKDKWQNEFDAADTKKEEFQSLSLPREPDMVMMMYQDNDDIFYYEDDNLQAVRLFYKKGNHIDIILPRRNKSFKRTIEALTAKDLQFDYRREKVHIWLPRFKIAYKSELNDYFKNWQIPLFFNDKDRDLTAMCGDCFVKKIIHQAEIILDEEGTVARAASISYMFEGAPAEEIKPKIFKADRPFIYIINDGLFAGAYVNGELY